VELLLEQPQELELEMRVQLEAQAVRFQKALTSWLGRQNAMLMLGTEAVSWLWGFNWCLI